MARRIKRAQQQKQSKAEKKATRQQRLKKVMAITGLLCLSPNFIFPPAAMAVNVNTEAQLNAALDTTPIDITFTGNISATANLNTAWALYNATVNGNNYTLYGGGVHSLLDFSYIQGVYNINSLTLSGGLAAYGGGMYVAYMSGGDIKNNIFTGNSATTNGGGMYVYSMEDGSISGNSFTSNSAPIGGGMIVGILSDGSITGNNFADNSATTNGGGMLVVSMNNGSISDNSFTNNSAASHGGGMRVELMAGGSITNNSFTSNSAATGGGMYIYNSMTNGSITNNSFIDNSAASQGAGMWVTRITNGNISANSFIGNTITGAARAGGGMYVSAITGGNISGNTFGGGLPGQGNSINGNSGQGAGLAVYSMGGGSIEGNNFTGNLLSGASGFGGGLHINSMTNGGVSSNSFIGNTISSTAGFGGGMYISGMAGGNVTSNHFNANSATSGGGVYVDIVRNGNLNSNNFSANSAASGGGVFVRVISGGAISDNVFGNALAADPASLNSAQLGGGMYVNNINGGSIEGNIFGQHSGGNQASSGGGMYVNSMTGGSIEDNSFSANSASATSGRGGGLFINSFTSGSLSANSFISNTASGSVAAQGGGMYVGTITGSAARISGNTFSANSAASGAGIFASGFGGRTEDNIFNANSAASGAGIFANNFGGSAQNNTFTNNSAANHGGGMYVNSMTGGGIGGELAGAGNTFSANQAASGGGMYVNGMSGGRVGAELAGAGNIFNANQAAIGGGMFVSRMTGGNAQNNTFTNNSATNQGGGMYVSMMTGGNVSGNTFTNNSATNDGGGMVVDIMSNGSVSGNVFGNAAIGDPAGLNSAQLGGGMYVGIMTGGSIEGNIFGQYAGRNQANNGGGMYVNGMSGGNVSGNTFTNNSATGSSGGGGMFVQDMTGGSIQGNTFTNNSAASHGGGMYILSATGGDITDNIFTNNKATAYGGAIYYTGSAANGQLNLSATAGGSAIFSGNTQANSTELNSIYFANPASGDNTVAVNIDVDANGEFIMHDPMMAQAAGAGSLTVNLTKSGEGVWQLAGHNDMQGPGNWNINQGVLRLIADAGGNAAHINLSDAATANFSLGTGAGLSLEALGTGRSHEITANTINLAQNSIISVESANLTATDPALKLNGAITLPATGAIIVDALNAGALAGTYTLIEDTTGNTDFTGKVTGLFDGSLVYAPPNERYAGQVYYLNTPGEVQIEVSGTADIARIATWDNDAGSGLWNLTAKNWILGGSALKVYKAGDSPVFSGSPDGEIKVDGAMLANVMTVQSGNYTFSPHNAGGDKITGSQLDITGGQATFALPIDFYNGGAGVINVGGNMILTSASRQLNTGTFSLAANAGLTVPTMAGGSYEINAANLGLNQDAVITIATNGLLGSDPALKLTTTNLSLPGGANTFTVDALNVGALDGVYVLIDETSGTTDFNGKVKGLFDGQSQSSYVPLNPRYGVPMYNYSQPGQVRLIVDGADIARSVTWTNDSGDNLWNQTSQNWVMDAVTFKVYKAGDSPIFSGNPDGTVKVDGAMEANVMTVQNGSYTFSPNNNAGDGIIGNKLDITGGKATFDVPLDFSNGGAGSINVAKDAGLILAPNAANVLTSTFTLNGSLSLVPFNNSYVINAGAINLNSGGQIGVTGFSHGAALNGSRFNVLQLAANNITKDSKLITSGSFSIGFYDYNYNNLYWDGDKLVLVLGDSPGPGPGPGPGSINFERAAGSAIGGPGAIMAQNTPGNWLMPRFKYTHWINKNKNVGQNLAAHMLNPGQWGGLSLDGEPDLLNARGLLLNHGAGMESGHSFADTQPVMLASFATSGDPKTQLAGWRANAAGGGDMLLGNGSLWFTPSYSYTDNSGQAGYNIKTPTWAGGYEQWFKDSFFLGLAVAGSLPEYESAHADIDAKHISFSLYGGLKLPWDMELGAFAAYGHTDYDQTRRVEGETYSSKYDSKNIGFGLNLGRDFMLDKSGLYVLRPFASYEYMHLDVDGYNEGAGQKALDIDNHKQNLHFVRAGVDGTISAENSGAFVTGSVYYAGLYGDREAETRIFFTSDPANSIASAGDALDEHSLGLGLSAGLPLGENVELQAGYNFLVGEDNKTHQGNISFIFKF